MKPLKKHGSADWSTDNVTDKKLPHEKREKREKALVTVHSVILIRLWSSVKL